MRGANSGPWTAHGKDEEKGLAMSTVPALGAATSLSCRECGEQYPISPRYACEMCFGPLEVAYDYAGVSREAIEAGPRNIWRYRQLLPVPANVADTANDPMAPRRSSSG